MHDNLFKNLDFELLIQKQKNDRFKATTPAFPHCKGFGATKQEAITKLCNSIGNFLKESTQDFLKLHLLGNNYTEVITDPNNNDDFEHRIISIGGKSNIVDHRVFLKSLSSMIDSLNIPYATDHSSNDSFNIKDFISEGSPQENDDLILGINLCLN